MARREVIAGVLLLLVFPGPTELNAIPAFARRYRTSCSTCHTAAPKLNPLGEAFRLNGYRFPFNDKLIRKEEPVSLGAEPWKDLWPRAIWPGELAGSVPLSIRIANDVTAVRSPGGETRTSFRFPDEIYLLGAAEFGDGIGAFLETEWTRESGLEVKQARVQFQLSGADEDSSSPSLNLGVGQQNLYLFTFTDRQIDRAARVKFAWQDFRYSDVILRRPATADSLRSTNAFKLGLTQPAIELNGVGWGRLYYGVGVAQGAGDASEDNNDVKDVFYKLRYKFGGLSLDGRYAEGDGPLIGGEGQLLEYSLTLETFGYFGAEPLTEQTDDHYRSFGVNARALLGRLDIGIGLVGGSDDDPWGLDSGGISYTSVLGKAEYMFYPWLIGSVKIDNLDVDLPDQILADGFSGGADETRIIPGVIALIRPNVRAVAEFEIFTRFESGDVLDLSRPHGLFLRLDVAF